MQMQKSSLFCFIWRRNLYSQSEIHKHNIHFALSHFPNLHTPKHRKTDNEQTMCTHTHTYIWTHAQTAAEAGCLALLVSRLFGKRVWKMTANISSFSHPEIKWSSAATARIPSGAGQSEGSAAAVHETQCQRSGREETACRVCLSRDSHCAGVK